jgi:bacteriorhodopsin
MAEGKNIMLKMLQISTFATLVSLNEALAQTSPATPGSPAAPATAAPATVDDGGANWLWIILGLVIIAGLVWYFMRGRSRTTTTSTTGTSGTTASRTNVYDNDKRP